jgi:hypothetical protein
VEYRHNHYPNPFVVTGSLMLMMMMMEDEPLGAIRCSKGMTSLRLANWLTKQKRLLSHLFYQ